MLASLSVRWKIIDKNANAWEVFPYFPTWKGIRILKSEEVLLVESAIPEFSSRGFHNPGLRNPEYSSRDPESTNDLECGIEVVPANNPESGAHNYEWATSILGLCHGVFMESRIQDCPCHFHEKWKASKNTEFWRLPQSKTVFDYLIWGDLFPFHPTSRSWML